MFNRLLGALRGRGAAREQAPAPASPAPTSTASTIPPSGTLPLEAWRARVERGEAMAVCTELLDLVNRHPGNADLLALYGWALLEVSAIEEARGALEAALRVQPNHAEALNTLGAIAAETDDPKQATGWFADALDANPGDLAAQYNLAQALFLDGQYGRGFDLLRARHRLLFGKDNPLAPMPMWQGESLEGKQVFVWCDWGGLGDHLQFIRYLPELARHARPARILLGSSPAFEHLFSRMDGVFGWVGHGHAPMADLHCPLLDLPHHFGTGVNNIPAAIPYLAADPHEAAQWAQHLTAYGVSTDTLRVGLAWKSTGPDDEAPIYKRMRRTKSVPPQLLAPLAASGARFVGLQPGTPAYESAATGLTMFDCAGVLRDFSVTAAILANLDLVISADTSLAHLAGAMGKPVLLLLRRESGLFWLHDREDSPWYPTMRILRQRQSGDWAPVIEEAAHWLEIAAREGAQAIIPARAGA
jgi:tetratricopeptide (TPR) repeat protein